MLELRKGGKMFIKGNSFKALTVPFNMFEDNKV